MRLGLFDLLGFVAVGCFVAVLGVDLQGLRSTSREVDIRLTDVEKEQGFRPGVSWFALYLDDDKVGFVRLVRERENAGFSMQQDAVLDIEALGSATRFEVRLQAALDSSFRLERFSLELTSAVLDVTAAGVVADREMDLVVAIGDIEDRTTIVIDDRPLLDIGVNSLVLSRKPRIGQVIELEVFDPFGLKPAPVSVEYLGFEQIAVVDGAISVHRLRRSVAGSVFDVWVNDLGEVLREELPLGLLAIRETEAAATWGFRQAGEDRPDRLELPPDLLGLVRRGDRKEPAAP